MVQNYKQLFRLYKQNEISKTEFIEALLFIVFITKEDTKLTSNVNWFNPLTYVYVTLTFLYLAITSIIEYFKNRKVNERKK